MNETRDRNNHEPHGDQSHTKNIGCIRSRETAEPYVNTTVVRIQI